MRNSFQKQILLLYLRYLTPRSNYVVPIAVVIKTASATTGKTARDTHHFQVYCQGILKLFINSLARSLMNRSNFLNSSNQLRLTWIY
jgi:hypothetical protein